ncbi:MAG: DUF2125 domain-containing protein [Rhodobacteraceae bacterium]|nr:DUF2125 domain-containing protein [Paracoccaceae bacterium]
MHLGATPGTITTEPDGELMMFLRQIAVTGSLISALLCGTAARALTADEVWTGWQANLALLDLTVAAGSTTKEGAVTTLRNITIVPEGEPPLTLPELVLTETAEGAVTVTLPDVVEIVPPANSNPGDTGQATLRQKGLVITVTEPAPGARNYAYAADTVQITADFTNMVDMFDGTPPKPSRFKTDVNIIGLAGSYSDTADTIRSFENDVSATTISYTFEQDDPFIGQQKQASVIQNLALQGRFRMPATLDLTALEDPLAFEQAVRGGLALTVGLTQGATTSDQSMTSDFLNYGVVSETTGGSLAMDFGQQGAAITVIGQPAKVRITSTDMPIPFVDLTMGKSDMEIKAPLIGSELQDFRYMVKIDGLSVNEEAWAMVDPTAILPRTPLLIDLDVTGRAAIDLFAIIAAEERGEVPPVPQIESLNIPRLLIAAAGAEVSGTGAFTFDNTQGVPMPRGKADLTVKGANKMIDALIALQVMSPDEAMGARMAMALMLEPSAEPDVGTSQIEAREDGGIYVNGQRMQ